MPMTVVRRQCEVLIERPLIRHYLLPIPAMDPKRVYERKGSIANIESVCAAGVPSDEVIKSPWANFQFQERNLKRKDCSELTRFHLGMTVQVRLTSRCAAVCLGLRCDEDCAIPQRTVLPPPLSEVS